MVNLWLLIIYHKKNICKWTAKISAINIVTLFLGHVDLLTTRTEYFDPGGTNFLTHANGQNMLPFTQDSGTDTEHSFKELLFHHSQSFGGEYKPGMNQAIDISGLLIDGKISSMEIDLPFVFELLIFRWFGPENHFQSFTIFRFEKYL